MSIFSGGLGSMLGQLAGSLFSADGSINKAGLGQVIETNLINQHLGGLQGLVDKFQQSGLGPVVSSWISNGQNQQISTDMLHKALGSDVVQKLAASTGLPVDQLLGHLADHLPDVVNRMTPNGQIPPQAT